MYVSVKHHFIKKERNLKKYMKRKKKSEIETSRSDNVYIIVVPLKT